MLFLRQTWTLTWKNILVVLVRHPLSTPLRCFLLPVIFIGFLAYARNLFIPPARYGIGRSVPVRSLSDALDAAGGGRDRVVFVNSGFTGGDIDTVIQDVASTVKANGKDVQVVSDEDQLLTLCRSTLRRTSTCYGAAVFYASPTEGPGGMWNYSLRADGGLGTKIYVTADNNDVEIYPLPLQHAIDFSIATHNSTIDQGALPDRVYEYPFTSETQEQRNDRIRVSYMGGIIDILAVAFFIGIVGVVYQLVGLIASERELGMTQIIEASMPNQRRWEPQLARLLGNHIAFDMIFLPGWFVAALILKYGVFAKTSVGILIVFNLLAGLSLSSFSLFGGAFFHKAQLSGISTTIISLLLAVLAQVVGKASTGAVAILSLLFPPMNYTFFTILMARWERKNIPTNLVKAAPENPSTVPGIIFFILLIIQILVFPILGALVERILYGTASPGRKLMAVKADTAAAVELSGFTKVYRPSWWARNIATRFGKRKDTVTAVDNLNLTMPKGQITVLLGANGSGKTTTLETIAGLNTVTSGNVIVDGRGGLGICPQRNVLWDQLTSYEHVRIFNRLKSTGESASRAEIEALVASCDLAQKLNAKARTLSGGQKRKLQLSIMFTGGSRVCCVDECSSGVDALARQKLWQILLAERGARTIIFTTHFLDEADLLSDHIAILSKGSLKAQGSSVELKHQLGGGYRVHVYNSPGRSIPVLDIEGATRKVLYDQTVYTLPDSALAAALIRKLEEQGINNYEVTSPTIEEIFFNVAEDTELSHISPNLPPDNSLPFERMSDDILETERKAISAEDAGKPLELETGRRIGVIRQALTLFRKRFTVFQRNWFPYIAAFLIPVIAAGLVTLFLKNFSAAGCSPTAQVSASDIQSLLTQVDYDLVVGPSSKLSTEDIGRIGATLPGARSGAGGGVNLSSLYSQIHVIGGTLDDFNNYINTNFANVTPGGFFLGDADSPPTFAYKANGDLSLATITQNALDTLLTNVSISSQYQAFDVPWVSGAGKTLQLIVYLGLALSVYPALFALYPTLERLRNVRQLHYSNGVRSICLWTAYITFDFLIVLASSTVTVIIFRGVSNQWYHLEYLFVVFFCFGLTSTLLSYVISLFARSQLAAFAIAAGYQAVMFLLYFIAYLSVLTYAPTNKIDDYVNITHFCISLITPMGSLTRAMFASLNVFSILCRDHDVASYPGQITVYGGPILYLVLQSIVLFCFLLWWDSASLLDRLLRKTHRSPDSEASEPVDSSIAQEIQRASASTTDGLRALHLTKAFDSNVAVQDITFGVQRGEVFALLGPNGAGKSTTISMIRGDIRPSLGSGDVFVENIPISKSRALARNSLGVCPQVDACDQMTVTEHLTFYARVRGVERVAQNVAEGLRAVGLESFANRMAAKLSGGNKRKLSLAIALMGNPAVLLLDEPSSGMDVCAKRIMWRTLASVVPGRSLVLTTHSMEEADALADRAGIMAKKMLALGTSEGLRKQFGDRFHVHLITKTAPHTPIEEMDRIKRWIASNLPGAEIEERTFHGQLRFSVPASSSSSPSSHDSESESESKASIDNGGNNGNGKEIEHSPPLPSASGGGIGALFILLESKKEYLGFEYFSLSQTTLDQVFLAIVGKHNIEEENYGPEKGKRPAWQRAVKVVTRGALCGV